MVELKKRKNNCKGVTTQKNDFKNSQKAKSIIDLLHQRIVFSPKKFKVKTFTAVSQMTTATVNDDLLPTPDKESEKVFGFKKNIFEAFVLKSRTRTENNALRKQETLKKVFGAGDDRPKSAPPVGNVAIMEDTIQNNLRELEPTNKITYDQKYREYLEKMNLDFQNIASDGLKNYCENETISIKDEDFEDDDNETLIEHDFTSHLKGRVKKSRGRRCKGSSG